MMHKSIFGTISNANPEKVVNELGQVGFPIEDLSLLFADRNNAQCFIHEKHTKAPEGAATGVSTGGVIGGVLGWLAGIGSLAIPGIGPFIAAGPILAALGGGAIGATLGGFIGSLVGLGIPEYEAKLYADKLKAGDMLVVVHVEDKAELKQAKETLKNLGAQHITESEEIPAIPMSSKPTEAPHAVV